MVDILLRLLSMSLSSQISWFSAIQNIMSLMQEWDQNWALWDTTEEGRGGRAVGIYREAFIEEIGYELVQSSAWDDLLLCCGTGKERDYCFGFSTWRNKAMEVILIEESLLQPSAEPLLLPDDAHRVIKTTNSSLEPWEAVCWVGDSLSFSFLCWHWFCAHCFSPKVNSCKLTNSTVGYSYRCQNKPCKTTHLAILQIRTFIRTKIRMFKVCWISHQKYLCIEAIPSPPCFEYFEDIKNTYTHRKQRKSHIYLSQNV